MDKDEVTTLTLLDLLAAFENKPEYLTDLLVGPKCSKCLHSTISNRFFVHLETSPHFAPNTSPLLFNAFPSPFSTSSSIFNASQSPFKRIPVDSMPLRHLLPPYIACQCFCVNLYRLFFAFLTLSCRSLMPVLRHLAPLHRP